MSNDVQVALLADTPAEENREVVQATADLIRAARNDQLVAVVCTHAESKSPATILCYMHKSPDNPNQAIYVPMAMLLDREKDLWKYFTPPSSAIAPPGPLEGLEDEREEDDQSASS